MKERRKGSSADSGHEGGAGRFRRIVEARLPTEFGNFSVIAYEDTGSGSEHLAIVRGDVEGGKNVLVRVHSECLTGDALGSRRCDCGEQLRTSMRMLGRRRKGVLLYLRQEGRGIGLINKMIAYHIQDQGADTVEANLLLGFEPDERSYDAAAYILKDLGILSVVLLTNNPDKIESLRSLGVRVSGRVPLIVGVNRSNIRYIVTKKRKLNHMIDENQLLKDGKKRSA